MTRFEWFDADKVTAAGYAAGERAADGYSVDPGKLAVEIEGSGGSGAIIQGTKSELLRFATDIIEATLIAEARDQDRKLRLQALQAAEAGVDQLRHAWETGLQFKLSPEQSAAYKAAEAAGKVAGYYEHTPEADFALTPEQAAAFKAGEPVPAGGIVRAYTMDERTAAAVKAGTVGGYSIGDTSLEDLPADDWKEQG